MSDDTQGERSTYNPNIDTAGMIVAVIAGMLAWYVVLVRPHDEFVGAVAGCMTEDSRAEWDRCAVVVRDKLKASR